MWKPLKLTTEKTAAWKRYKDGKLVPVHEVVELDCDILVLCAVANQVNAGNVDRIKAKVVVEGANAPTTPEADEVLAKRGVHVLPDILSNSAAVTVGYFEWVQGLMGTFLG